MAVCVGMHMFGAGMKGFYLCFLVAFLIGLGIYNGVVNIWDVVVWNLNSYRKMNQMEEKWDLRFFFFNKFGFGIFMGLYCLKYSRPTWVYLDSNRYLLIFSTNQCLACVIKY